jgi:hypothetical protein
VWGKGIRDKGKRGCEERPAAHVDIVHTHLARQTAEVTSQHHNDRNRRGGGFQRRDGGGNPDVPEKSNDYT